MGLSETELMFPCGLRMKNRFMLAPLTNCQSHEDGTLSEDEFHWLTLRAKGQFGMTMTCAAHVQAAGRGFPGQLGIFADFQRFISDFTGFLTYFPCFLHIYYVF